MDAPQRMVSAFVGKIQIRYLQKHLPIGECLRGRLLVKPGLNQLFLLVGQAQFGKIGRTHRRLKLYTGIFQRCNIQRFPDAFFLQKSGAEQGVRIAVVLNATVAHKHNPVNRAIQNILYAVLNDDDRTAGALLNLIDENNRLFAGGGVQICQRFVKQKHVHRADHDAAQTDTLFLTAGNLVGRVFQNPLHIHKLRDARHLPVHFFRGNAVVFKGEGDIFCHSQTDKLTIGILQHRADDFR